MRIFAFDLPVKLNTTEIFGYLNKRLFALPELLGKHSMPIPSTLTDENGQIAINPEACCGCGVCVSGCPDRSLRLEGGKAVVSSQSIFGCFACGYCMSVCPCDAIQVSAYSYSGDIISNVDIDAEKKGISQ